MQVRKPLVAAAVLALALGGAGAPGASAAPASTAAGPVGAGPLEAGPLGAGDPWVVGVRATDAPRVVRVGAAVTTTTITVVTPSTYDALEASITTVRDPLGTAPAPEPGRPTVFKPQVVLHADRVQAWGPAFWDFYAYRLQGEGSVDGAAWTDVRAHSMLGLATSRSGSQVAVRGSARAYHSVQDRYVAWSGRPVSVQRWTGSAWVQVAGVTTDARGDVATSVAVPAGSQLRLVVRDASTIWGAVSATRSA